MVLFRHNLPQPTQAQLMRGEFPETLCIEQGVVLSCRFAESKVRWTSRVLWMAVVSQSSVKLSRWNSASSGVGSKPFLNNNNNNNVNRRRGDNSFRIAINRTS